MESLTVYSKEELTSLWNIVKDRFPSQTVWMQKNRDGDYTLTIKKQYDEPFSNVLSKWIHQRICRSELEKKLEEYQFLSPEERNVIFLSAMDKIRETQEDMVLIIQEKIRTILGISSKIKLEGFLCFCLQEYRKKMEEVIEECFESYWSEQDYLEFLDLLRYFIEVEECRFEHLIVVAQPDGNYCYYDEGLQNITRQCMEYFLLEYDDMEAKPDDCLITILILMMPERISVFGMENMANLNFINTIRSIFGHRVNFYQGTEIFTNKKM